MSPLDRAQRDVRKLRRLCTLHDRSAIRHRLAGAARDVRHVEDVMVDRATLGIAEARLMAARRGA